VFGKGLTGVTLVKKDGVTQHVDAIVAIHFIVVVIVMEMGLHNGLSLGDSLAAGRLT